MPRMFRTLLKAVALAGFLAAAPGVAAEVHRSPSAPPIFRLAASQGVSLEQAIRKVRDVYGDITILKAETVGRQGRQSHRIKFLTASGRVKTVQVDARTGEFR